MVKQQPLGFVAVVSAVADKEQNIHINIDRGGAAQFMPFPHVVFAESPDRDNQGAMLYRYRNDGTFCGDTWHESLEEAQQDAKHEYGTALGPWSPVPPKVTNPHSYAVAFVREPKSPIWRLFHRLTVKKKNYTQLSQFRYYDLAEGYLLELREGDPMQFIVDAALTREYPQKEPFLRWRKILISFPNVRQVRWIRKTMNHPAIDRDGKTDFGGIYQFEIQGYRHHLSGDFGDIEIISDPVEVEDIAHETTDMWGAVPDDPSEVQ